MTAPSGRRALRVRTQRVRAGAKMRALMMRAQRCTESCFAGRNPRVPQPSLLVGTNKRRGSQSAMPTGPRHRYVAQ